METIAVNVEVIKDIKERLLTELEFYKAVEKKFRRKYGCSLEELEKRIEKESVPTENHEVWEDSIEWRNAVEEIKRIEKLLKDINVV